MTNILRRFNYKLAFLAPLAALGAGVATAAALTQERKNSVSDQPRINPELRASRREDAIKERYNSTGTLTQSDIDYLQSRGRNTYIIPRENWSEVPTKSTPNLEPPTKTQPNPPKARPQPTSMVKSQPKPKSNRGSNTTRPVRGRRQRAKTIAPPSTVTLAPVSIGNTIRGTQSRVVQTRDGCVIHGRDFMFTPIGTGTIETWTLAGGAPLTPCAFVDSTLRQYMQMYNKFRFKAIVAHYLTSSPTSSDGDIMFYYSKNRESVFLNQTSNNLLPFVISDPNTVLGPQWQNHSASFDVASDWKSTDYGMDPNCAQYAAGELFLLTKSTTTDSPGYVMFDYIIEFQEHSLIPRLLTLPLTKVLWNNVAVTVGGPFVLNAGYGMTTAGNNLQGTPSVIPPGTTGGDVFKVIFDRTNSTLVAGSSAFLTSNITGSPFNAANQIVLNDGTTFYAVYGSNNNWAPFANLVDAYAGNTGQFLASANLASATSTLQLWVSYVGSVVGITNQPNF